jgi:hypothetical protein
MIITSKIKAKNQESESGFELEYFHYPGFYQLTILEFRKGRWHAKNCIEFNKTQAAELSNFINMTLKMPEL